MEEGAAKQRRTISILMLPWLAHGHISPFLELAKKLSKRNFHIYFCSTPVNLKPVEKQLGETAAGENIKPVEKQLGEKAAETGENINNEDDEQQQRPAGGIQLVEYHLPCLPNLPPHYHTTNGLPPHLMQTLKDALNMSAVNSDQGFTSLLESLKPDLVIYDYIQSWAPTIALSHNIPAVQFQTLGASAISYYIHLLLNKADHEDPDSSSFDSKYPFPELIIPDFYQETIKKMKSDQANKAMRGSWKIVLLKTSPVIEGKYLDHLSSCISKRIVLVGPLVRDEPLAGEHDEASSQIMRWLDSKEPSSTVFASFGSEYFCSDDEIEEIAKGLELCRNVVNFIWVIRFPLGEGKRPEQVLPAGFLERIDGKRGFIAEGWAPQMRILKHQNVGGFLSHCGWSSVLESMKVGVPIIAMPMQIDQPVNARLVEGLGNGLEVKRDGDGKCWGDEIARVVNKVMVEEKVYFRKRAKELSDLMLKKGDDDVDVAAEELIEICREFNKIK